MTYLTNSTAIQEIKKAFGNDVDTASDPWKLDNADEVKNVVNIIAKDGRIDESDISNLRKAGVKDTEIKALLIYYYGSNDEKTIDALLGDTNSFFSKSELKNEMLDKGLDHKADFAAFEDLRDVFAA